MTIHLFIDATAALGINKLKCYFDIICLSLNLASWRRGKWPRTSPLALGRFWTDYLHCSVPTYVSSCLIISICFEVVSLTCAGLTYSQEWSKMKVSRLSLFQKAFWGPFYCLMLVTLSGSHTEDQNTFSDISDRNSLRFIETTNHYLRIQQILQTDYVYDAIQCALNCLVKTPCISFNFRLKADLKGKHLCELLASDKFKHAIYLQPDAEFHHYSIWVSCFF